MATSAPEHRPLPTKGIPLELKLTASVGLLVALFMAGFGLLLHDELEQTIRAQILHEAVNSARTAAHADLVVWTENYATIDEGLAPDAIQARVDGESRAQYDAYIADEARLAQIAWNEGRLDRMVAGEERLLGVEIFRWQDGARGVAVDTSYALGDGASGATFTTTLASVEIGRGEATEGRLRVQDDERPVIRGSYPIVARDGAKAGEVVTYINASAIEDAATAFSENVAYAGAGFLAVSVILAYIVARTLTSPVRRLRADTEAVAAGDLSHRTHPHSHDEIGQIARTFEYMTRWLARAEKAERVAEHDRHELEAAAEVTASLFPKTLPQVAGWSLGGLHDREASPGGGTYDALQLPGGRLGLYVAEASAGGAPGALVTAMARASLRYAAEQHDDPGAVLRAAHEHLAPDLGAGITVAAVFVVLDPSTGRVTVANAGHRPPLHHHAARDGIGLVQTDGVALGAEGFDAALQVGHVTLDEGDSLVLFASEISMLAGTDGEVLGERRLAAMVKEAAGVPADQLVERVGEALRDYHGDDSLGADVTLVAVGRRA